MISTTFRSVTAYLLDDIPTWTVEPKLTAKLVKSSEQGLIGIETRRLTGDTLRIGLSFTTVLSGAKSVTNFRNSLQALGDEPVLCPLWPAMFAAGATPQMTASYYVAIGDGLTPVIHAAADLPLTRPACPLMVGRFKSLPNPSLIVGTLCSVKIEFEENDDLYLTPPTYNPPSGLNAANGTRPLFPFRSNWSSKQTSGGSDKDVERQSIGSTRGTSDAYYTQLARRTAQNQVTLYQNNDPWNLLSFYAAIGVNNFWLPVGIEDAALTASVVSTDTTLTVDDNTNIGNNTTYALSSFVNRVLVSVTGVTGANTINLSGAVGAVFASAVTRLESLILARFDGDDLEMTFRSVNWCDCQLRFTEVPYETVGATSETIGSTFGPLPTTAYLYAFSLKFPGGVTNTYTTNFERDLTYGGNTYTHSAYEHDDINESDNLDRQTTVITSRNAASNPLTLLAPFVLEYPLMVTITEVDISGSTASNPRVLFYGEVESLDVDGPYLKGNCASNSAIFERQIPRRLIQTGCNWILFEPKCSLLASNWTWNAVTTAWDTVQLLTVGTITSTNGASLAANLFAGGSIQVFTGNLSQFRLITSSMVVSGGTIVLTLSNLLVGAIANGTAVVILPGCDGLLTTCTSKFNNFVNFGGFPFVPIANPTLLQSQSINQGKKG